MRLKTLKIAAAALAALAAAPVMADVFQWTDARGVIHFSDNLHSVPLSLRASPRLIVRQDFFAPSESPILVEPVTVEPIGVEPAQATAPGAREPKTPPAPRASESEAAKPAPIIYNNPQFTTVVVINNVARRRERCALAEGCRGVFRPNPNERSFIHPSAFTGGSRQHVQPELFPSSQR